MLNGHHSIFAAVIYGALLGILIAGALYLILPWMEPGKSYPFWAHFLSKTGEAFVAVAPGFCAGYLARRAGLWVGAVAGITIPFSVALATSALTWPSVIESQEVGLYFLSNLFSAIFSAAITNGVSGLAGEYLGTKREAF